MRQWFRTLMLTMILFAVTVPVSGKNEITPQDEESPLLTFQVLSDIHLVTDSAVRKFRTALNDLRMLVPKSDALVINGDLGNGRPQDYATLSKIMNKEAHPTQLYYTIGNHEFYKAWYNRQGEWSKDSFPNGETDQASIDRFLRLSGEPKVYYDRWVHGYHFIMLGSELYRQTNPSIGDDAYLSNEQLTWLKARLAEGDGATKPTFVFIHQPLPQTVGGSSLSNYRGVMQHRELKALLAQYPQVILFSGHTHWELKLPKMVVQDGYSMVNSSSVYEPWTSSDMPIPAIKGSSEGLVVEVYKNHVRVRGVDFHRHQWILSADHVIAR